MAHDKCIGTWEKSKLDGADDGRIRVNAHTGNTFTGRHLKTGASLENTSCDGTNISFSRVDTAASERVSYRGRIVQDGNKHKIQNGRFTRTPARTDSTKGRSGKSAERPDFEGTWESEKVT